MSYPEDQFDEVRRLLGCKRYEKPPPGYFNSFSARVVARIEAEEAVVGSSWWSWLVDRFDAKPVLVCAYGLAVSSLLFFGFRLSQAFEAEAAGTSTLTGPWLAVTPASPIFYDLNWDTSAGSLLASGPRQDLKTDSLLPGGSLRIQPATYRVGNW
jgi:hypothetical protein